MIACQQGIQDFSKSLTGKDLVADIGVGLVPHTVECGGTMVAPQAGYTPPPSTCSLLKGRKAPSAPRDLMGLQNILVPSCVLRARGTTV